MILSEFAGLCSCGTQLWLKDAFNGKVVAKSRNAIKKYGEVPVFNFFPIIDASADGSYAHPVICCWGSHAKIEEIKSGGNK